MKDQDQLIAIRQYNSNVDAHMAREILENEGIPCMLTNETFVSSVYPSLGDIRLLVFERDAQKALEILDNINNNTHEQ